MKRLRPHQGAATSPLLWLFAGASWLGVAGCLEGNLPSVVSRGSAGADAATQSMPPGDGQLKLEVADALQPAASESGEIVLTIGLPIDTSTGKVASIGSLNVRLWSDGLAPRSLTLQLSHPTAEINLSLVNIAAGGPYTLEVMATANGGVACAGSSPPFFVPALQTVRVLESVICGGDAGFASTL